MEHIPVKFTPKELKELINLLGIDKPVNPREKFYVKHTKDKFHHKLEVAYSKYINKFGVTLAPDDPLRKLFPNASIKHHTGEREHRRRRPT